MTLALAIFFKYPPGELTTISYPYCSTHLVYLTQIEIHNSIPIKNSFQIHFNLLPMGLVSDNMVSVFSPHDLLQLVPFPWCLFCDGVINNLITFVQHKSLHVAELVDVHCVWLLFSSEILQLTYLSIKVIINVNLFWQFNSELPLVPFSRDNVRNLKLISECAT